VASKLQNVTTNKENFSVELEEGKDGNSLGIPDVALLPVVTGLGMLFVLLPKIAEGEALVAAKPTWFVTLSKTIYKPRINVSPRIV